MTDNDVTGIPPIFKKPDSEPWVPLEPWEPPEVKPVRRKSQYRVGVAKSEDKENDV